ncbi:MAG TPA: GNAT family N-acetyltransferase [Mycobacteriales bacterium]|nr:GNAT family N-acetyltransferase [Mycobacteriales bacterium]
MTAQVVHDEAAGRFEARSGQRVAGYAEYEVREGTMVISHVVVQPRFEGQGIGSAVTRAALSTAREQGWGVLPLCSFAAAYVRRNPDLVDLVPLENRALVGLQR